MCGGATDRSGAAFGLCPSLVVFWSMPRFFFDWLGDSDVVWDPAVRLRRLTKWHAREPGCTTAVVGPASGSQDGQEGHRSAIDPAPVADGTT
jgi:hypothetical protein